MSSEDVVVRVVVDGAKKHSSGSLAAALGMSVVVAGAALAAYFFYHKVKASDDSIIAYQRLVEEYNTTSDAVQAWLNTLQSKQSQGIVQVAEMPVSANLSEVNLSVPVQTLEVYNVGPGSMKLWVNDLTDPQTLDSGQSNKIEFELPVISSWSHQLVDSAATANMRVVTTR